MPNGILKILLKMYGTKEMLSPLEDSVLTHYNHNCDEQELTYLTLITDKFFTSELSIN